jgi:hypothetical protein
MEKLIAISYDVCSHNDLFIGMNEIVVQKETMDEQVAELAKRDVAPIVRVFGYDGSKLSDNYIEYTFEQYQCDCGVELK